MKFLKLNNIYLLLLTLILSNCSKNENIITEPAGSAQYFINNETNKDIIIIYKTSKELGFETDTTQIIQKNTSLKIFEDGLIGVNPAPENSFSEIRFYESSDLVNSFATLLPVVNEDWSIINQNLDRSGYGLTTYEIKLID